MSMTSEALSTRDAHAMAWWREPDFGATSPARPIATPHAPRFSARLHRRIDDIADLWSRLQATGHATAYQRLDWLASLCTHLARPDQTLFVEVVDSQAGGAIMLLPLSIRRRFGVRVASWLSFGVCDYAAPVVAAGVTLSAAEASEAWAAVVSVLPGVDLIDIRQISPEVGGIVNPLTHLPQCRPSDLQAFGLPLEGDPETTKRRILGAKGQRDHDRRMGKLAQSGAVRLIEPCSLAEVEALFSTMVEQRRQRFRKLGRVDTLGQPDIERFYRDMAVRSLRDGGPARLFGLAVGDEVVATTYMLVHGGSMHGIVLSIGGSKWTSCSPGSLIAFRMIEWAAAQGLTYFDMTVGNLPYKSNLGGKPRTLYRLLEPRTTLGGWAMTSVTTSARAMAWLERHPRLIQSLRSLRQRIRRVSTRPSA